MPKMMKTGQIYNLTNEDIVALSSVGYSAKKLSQDESKESEVLRLTSELKKRLVKGVVTDLFIKKHNVRNKYMNLLMKSQQQSDCK